MTQPVLSGVYAAIVTPYDATGAVDAGVVRTITRYLINEGLAGVAAAGTTGEFPALTHEEKATVVRSACEAAGEEGKVVGGVWALAPAERSALAAEAAVHGAHALFLTTPIGAQPEDAALLEWYRATKRGSALPLFAYNIPQLTGYDLPFHVLEALAVDGTIAGYKDSSNDISRITDGLRRFKDRLTVFAGSEGTFADARAAGADGFISGLANVFPRTVTAVWRGDSAAALRLLKIKETVRRCGGLAAIKVLLGLRGFAIGAVRPPLKPVTDEARKELEALEREVGKGL